MNNITEKKARAIVDQVRLKYKVIPFTARSYAIIEE